MTYYSMAAKLHNNPTPYFTVQQDAQSFSVASQHQTANPASVAPKDWHSFRKRRLPPFFGVTDRMISPECSSSDRRDRMSSSSSKRGHKRRLPRRLLVSVLTVAIFNSPGNVLSAPHSTSQEMGFYPRPQQRLRPRDHQQQSSSQSLLHDDNDESFLKQHHLGFLSSDGPKRVATADNHRATAFVNAEISKVQKRKLQPDDNNSTHTESESTSVDPDLDDGHDQYEGENVFHMGNSSTFQYFFSATVGVILIFQAIMLGLLLWYRKDSNLQLAQPLVLAALSTSGSISILGCIFLIHNDRTETLAADDIYCRIRDLFLVTPLTFAGNILLARVWRIVLLLTPVLTAGKSVTHRESEDGLTCGDKCKGSLIFHSTNIADFYNWMEWVLKSMRRTSTALRKKVPLPQLFLLTIILTLPQVVLQILIATVPQLQKKLVTIEEATSGYVFGEQTPLYG